jgi:hypothetical protein
MILTIGPGGSGLTFLNWSIVYLRGDNFYTTLDKNTLEVVDNPIVENGTADRYKKDHIQQTVDLKKLHQANNQSVVYVVPTCQSDLEYILQFNSKKIIFNPTVCSKELLARMYYTVPNANPILELVNNLSHVHDLPSVKQVLIESNKCFTDYYKVPDTYQDYISIDYNNIFQDLDQKIYQIFNYLNLSISQKRVANWLVIYQKWKSVNKDYLSQFLETPIAIPNSKKLQILKDIIKWKNGQYRHTWQNYP